MHFTAATSRACIVGDVNVSGRDWRISPYAIGAAFVAAAPAIVESFVPPHIAPAIEIAGALGTAVIAARAATKAANVHTWADARTLLRDVLPHAPKAEGGLALGILRFVCGSERPRLSITSGALARLPKMIGGMLAGRARRWVPGAGLVLQGVRAASGALDAVALVTTLEALARRSAELAETRAALRVVDFPGVSEPTVSAAA
jgi:hypothetical protein